MALEKADIIKIRVMILREIRNVLGDSSDRELRNKISRMVGDAEAEEIALTNPAAAEVHRRLRTEF